MLGGVRTPLLHAPRRGVTLVAAIVGAALLAVVYSFFTPNGGLFPVPSRYVSDDSLTPYGLTYKALPELRLLFDGGRIELHAGADLLLMERFFASQPTITWDHLSLAAAPSLAYPGTIVSVFFIDFGPTRDLWAPQNKIFPKIHSLWTDCTSGSLDTCRTLAKWHRPGNMNHNPNRYAFFLFTHSKPLDFGFVTSLSNFSLPALIAHNPSVKPIATTYVSVHGM